MKILVPSCTVILDTPFALCGSLCALSFRDSCYCYKASGLLWQECSFGGCSGSSENSLHRLGLFEYLVPSWWLCLGRFRKCGLAAGNMLLRAGFEVLKSPTVSV